MKMCQTLIILTLFFMTTVRAQTADIKLGNVIAVERTISNIYQTCVDQFATQTSDSSFFSCKFDAKKSKEDIAPSAQRLLTLVTPACSVEGSLENSMILVMAQVKSANPNLAAAKACLQQAIGASTNKDNFKFVMYTVE